MRDAGGRHQVEHAIEQAVAGAQDRREHQLLAGEPCASWLQRRLDVDRLEREVARHLVAEQHGDLAQELAEALRGALPCPASGSACAGPAGDRPP